MFLCTFVNRKSLIYYKNESKNNERNAFMKDIQSILVNPFKLLNDVLSIPLPSYKMSYMSIISDTFKDLFDIIYDGDVMESAVSDFLDQDAIKDRAEKLIANPNALIFLQFIEYFSKDINELQKDIALKMFSCSKEIQKKVSAYKRLYSNMSIDERGISAEINTHCLDLNDKTSMMVARFIKTSIESVVYLLLGKNHEVEMKNKIEIDLARKEVNKLDSKSGVDLKHHKKSVESDKDFSKLILKYRAGLTAMILAINSNNNLEDYIDFKKKKINSVKIIKINKKKFRNNSVFDSNAVPSDSIVFKKRFVSYLIKWVSDNIYELLEKLYKISDMDYIEYDVKLSYLDSIIYELSNIVLGILYDRDIPVSIMYFEILSVYNDMHGYDIKLLRKIKNIKNQSMELDNRLMNSNENEAITLDTLFKLVYLVSTKKPKSNNIISFDADTRYNDKDIILKMIELLGKAIIKSDEISDIFSIFINCNGTTRTINSYLSYEQLVGITAINYYAFITGSKNIRKFINKIV